MLINLKNDLKYKIIKFKEVYYPDEYFANHLSFAFNNRDALSANYTDKAISRMVEYGYVFKDDPADMLFMVGVEDFGNGCLRSESRLFVHPKYRKPYWTSMDNYQTVITQINNHVDHSSFMFKSRTAKNTGGFRVSARLTNFFNDWVIHPKQIELRYKNNWQWIMYKNIKGNPNEFIESLYYKI